MAFAPSGAACVAGCTRDFTIDSVVTLTATPDSEVDVHRLEWRGGLQRDRALRGDHVARARAPSRRRSPSSPATSWWTWRAAGRRRSIASTPIATECTADCTRAVDIDTVVTLTAAPDATSTFTGWGEDCAGTGPCVVTLSEARSVTATFVEQTRDLDLTLAGNGGGTVASRRRPRIARRTAGARSRSGRS